MILARFKRHYAGEYRSTHYRTDDSIIPFGLFWILYAAMTHTLAMDRVNEARAITHALSSAFGKAGGPGAEFTRRELKEAFLAGGE